MPSGHKHLHLHYKKETRDNVREVQRTNTWERGNFSNNPDRNTEALNQFLVPLDVKDFDYNATVEYGRIRASLERSGTPIGPLDTLIAAHALSLNSTLVTNNEKEFNRVAGLKIENWTK
ncbi:PIN domain-containing protein [Adhaeribacter swui]|uniref:PIN domain-containing protein n=1 Tax=Adhaeribacter swui TaxID=2086471 RepID=UPI003743E5FA